jgi:SAM-dependent MidA family methyltransferase
MAIQWQTMGSPKDYVLAELGPGRGTLMADLLRAASMVPGFVQAARVVLVETSPTLREQQKLKLDGFDVIWVDQVEAIPSGPLLLIANEFFDALPIDQFVRSEGSWKVRTIDCDPKGGFTFALGEAAFLPYNDSDGTIREVCPIGQAIAAHLGDRLSRQGGMALIIDYGYGRSQPGDTVQAVKAHSYHPVLEQPGKADLTAHVDFEALAQAAIPARAHGVVSQGAFLKALGIETRLTLLANGKSDKVTEELAAGVRRLIDNDAMGALFKVMALAHPALPPPPGF